MRSCRRGRGLDERMRTPHAQAATINCYNIVNLANFTPFCLLFVTDMYPVAWRGLHLCSTIVARGAYCGALSACANGVIHVPGSRWADSAASSDSTPLCAAPTAQAPALPVLNRSEHSWLLTGCSAGSFATFRAFRWE